VVSPKASKSPVTRQGEYTTGWTAAGASKSDKKVGICFGLAPHIDITRSVYVYLRSLVQALSQSENIQVVGLTLFDLRRRGKV
jgi:hypothetical protein